MLTNWTKEKWIALFVFFVSGSALIYKGGVEKIFWEALLGLSIVLFILAIFFGRIRSLSIFVGFSFLTLAFVEWILIPSPVTYLDPGASFPKDYYTASDLGSSAKSGVYTARKVADSGNIVVYDVVYTIGDDGFRITPKEDLSHRFRVNFFGCSFTIGEGLNDNETLAYHSKSLLKNISVKNFGLNGYGVHQAVAIMESQRDTRGQVNFLLTAPWHSDRSACMPSYSAGTPKYLIDTDGFLKRKGVCWDTDQSFGLGRIRKLLDKSAIYKIVEGVVQTNQAKRSQDKNIDLYIALVKKMADLSRERGQALVIGFIKADESYFLGENTNETVLRRLRDISDEVIDLTLSEKSETTEAKYFIHHSLDRHPSSLANLERAKKLSIVLRRHI